ncbi:Bgt-50398 [Blumeria graminis f. sp. tritici]|uniref:Bgt-50398 n=1 Tax=Blumeria graminis f. sp. tritici TaxID=62690 RepID=A0A9X9QCV6_BLUGR|nr:Bgt-50398 [Blumeria graminis f. sp. tritici]
MRFSKLAMILQGASFFVATSSSFTTAHVDTKSKSFNCLGRIIKPLDLAKDIRLAYSHIERGYILGRPSGRMEDVILNDGQSNTIFYSDHQTDVYYLCGIRSLSYTDDDNGYYHHVEHYVLIDNLHRISAMRVDERWTVRDGSAVADREAFAPRQSYCTIGG